MALLAFGIHFTPHTTSLNEFQKSSRQPTTYLGEKKKGKRNKKRKLEMKKTYISIIFSLTRPSCSFVVRKLESDHTIGVSCSHVTWPIRRTPWEGTCPRRPPRGCSSFCSARPSCPAPLRRRSTTTTAPARRGARATRRCCT